MAKHLPTYLLLAVALAAGVAFSVWQQANNGSPNSEWKFTALDGGLISQSEVSSDAVLINFWATWCPPCLRELPLLSELATNTSKEKLSVLAVAYDDPKNIHKFLLENPLELDIAHGFEDVKAAMTLYGNDTGSLPFSVLLDRDGNVINKHLGELLPDTLDDFIKKP